MKFVFVFLLLTFSFVQKPIDKDYLLGQFDPSTDSRFIKLTSPLAKGSAVNRFLRKEAFEAFKKMASSAKKDGVNLFIVSAMRTFESQKKIWEDKWSGRVKVDGQDLSTVPYLHERAQFILLYSSMPGTSRHHWGTDIDINETEDKYFETEEGKKVYQWLTTHGGEFGFCQPYTAKSTGRTGYEEEKWHWSYMPLSKDLLQEYQKQLRYENITGFLGSEMAQPLQVIEAYVNGVGCQ